MILHPGILALLLGSLLILAIMLLASLQSVKILLNWDRSSSSEQQLSLERRTWLVSILVNFALAFQIITLILFVATAEDIHRLFVGAMCATGALNANLIGWLVLLVKGLLAFLSSFWVIFNRIDQRCESSPLIRKKYAALLVLTPLIGVDLYLQWRYFSGLQPEMITSCCGSLFSASGDSVASELVAMPVGEAMTLFFAMIFVYLVCWGWVRFRPSSPARNTFFIASLLFFFISLGAVISFISLYIYQMPTHHCPFDMLQGHYYFIGYPLYAALFVGSFFGMLPGLTNPLRHIAEVCELLIRAERSWLTVSLGGVVLFLLLACWPMLFGPLKLL